MTYNVLRFLLGILFLFLFERFFYIYGFFSTSSQEEQRPTKSPIFPSSGTLKLRNDAEFFGMYFILLRLRDR